MEWHLAYREEKGFTVKELESAMRVIYKTIIEDPLAWIGSKRHELDKKFLMSKGMMYYWEEKEEFEICSDLYKVCQIIMMIKERKLNI